MPTHADGEVAVLIPAAGEGTRLGGTRKQFRRLGDRPLLAQTLLVFERHPEVHHLVVAAPTDAVQALDMELRAEGITKLVGVVEGGETRQASVQAALAAVPSAADVVLVHDAVRPFVRAALVGDVIAAARAEGAAALAIPMADTVRRGQGGVFGETIERQHLYRMQTPQGFRRPWLEEAFTRAAEQNLTVTDDVALIQACGHPVHIVPGSPRNMKITTPDDWELAMVLWPRWEAVHAPR